MSLLDGKIGLEIGEVSWLEIKEAVKAINIPLYKMIEQLPLNKKHKLYKARYRFGDTIFTRGVFGLPITGGGTLTLKDGAIPSVLQKELGYKIVPMGLILTKSVEVFFENKNYVIPSKLYFPETIFGLWEAFDPDPPKPLVNVWNLTAGARSICMLPSISDAVLYKKLQQKFNLKDSGPPNKLIMHHKLFTELSRHIEKYDQEWFCEVLFFGKEWLNSQEAFKAFENYLLKQAWAQSYNCRTKMDYDIAWGNFNEKVTERNWKPKPYNLAIMKHLLAIGDGIYPAFVPAHNDDAAPITFLQDCIVNGYSLKEQDPIIMQPEHIGTIDKTYYFSLSMPTQLEHLHKGRKNPTIVNNLIEIKRMADLLSEIGISPIKCEFFHCDDNSYEKILPSSKIIELASNSTWHASRYSGRKFPEKSPFFKGCISIDKTKLS
jgi:hypothetical protein